LVPELVGLYARCSSAEQKQLLFRPEPKAGAGRHREELHSAESIAYKHCPKAGLS